jgi:hypothetical protein
VRAAVRPAVRAAVRAAVRPASVAALSPLAAASVFLCVTTLHKTFAQIEQLRAPVSVNAVLSTPVERPNVEATVPAARAADARLDSVPAQSVGATMREKLREADPGIAELLDDPDPAVRNAIEAFFSDAPER